MKHISILGSTGSIGRQCLSVVDSLPWKFEVIALAAGSNIELLAEQVARHKPKVVSAGSEEGSREVGERLRAALPDPMPEVLFGSEGMSGRPPIPKRRLWFPRWWVW